MLVAQIPKDIRKYDAKLVGPFTARQLVCFIGGTAASYGCYKLLGAALGGSTFTVCSLFAVPFILVGWIKPYGMAFEKFFKSAFISTVLAPRNRKYKTKNFYAQAADTIEKMSDSEYKKRIRKEKKLVQKNEKFIAYK